MDIIEYRGHNMAAVKDWLGWDMATLDSDGVFGICIGDGSRYTYARPGDTLTRDDNGDVTVMVGFR